MSAPKRDQLLRAQIGHDNADEEGDQRDDGDGGDAGFVDMPRQRRGPQRSRPGERLRRAPSRCGRRSRLRRALRCPASTAQRPSLPTDVPPRGLGHRAAARAACRSALSLCSRSKKCGGSPAWRTFSGCRPRSASRSSNAHTGPMPGDSAPRPIAHQCAAQRAGQTIELRFDLRYRGQRPIAVQQQPPILVRSARARGRSYLRLIAIC